MKKTIKNKHVSVVGNVTGKNMPVLCPAKLECIITNDEIGKTLSINNGEIQFTIPFEPIERYLK